MVDPTSMYPLGFIANHCLPDGNNFAEVIPRSAVSVTYYYIDFGIFSMASDDARSLVTGMSGLDRDVPELSDDVPYDPFKVDIFILEDFFRETFTDKSSNVGMLTPLIQMGGRARPKLSLIFALYVGTRGLYIESGDYGVAMKHW
ncbi:hypothetical protein K466DRAFT_665962 [Polyporus arcularius HHB13444]|uniref:Uncharacterized protein n=1 Tax=Polyporus arcularius HHB13444 TaxID=1314778 RepID=A0A5C3P4Q3_9APHY|nr:hypothetical protein K466DRAFT_665962 [Polyporus arcularius HHB13444]